MTGMYHRTPFVLVCYIGIFACGYSIQEQWQSLYDLLPAVVLFFASLIPLLRNSYKNMVQFLALTLLNFCFLWAFLHLGLILNWKSGAFIVLFIVILTEFFDTIYLSISKSYRYIRLVHNITPKRSLEGFVMAGVITLALAFLLRYFLPPEYKGAWALLGFICCLFGSTGDTVLAVVRRDLGIKVTDAFIWGRGDFFSRLDRLVFVAPIAFYALLFMERLT